MLVSVLNSSWSLFVISVVHPEEWVALLIDNSCKNGQLLAVLTASVTAVLWEVIEVV